MIDVSPRGILVSRAQGKASWIYHVLVPLKGHHFLSQLERMDRWLNEWEIPYEVVPNRADDSGLVVRFPSERFARAFISAQLEDISKVLPTCRTIGGQRLSARHGSGAH